MAVARAQPKTEGSDAIGYKVTLWGSASYKEATYVVNEEGQYRVLATSRNRAGVALEVLDRVSANDVTGARVLLDWLREDEHLSGDDDPLSGGAFPRLWTKGRKAEASLIKLAAAAILTESEGTAQRGVTIFEKGKDSTLSKTTLMPDGPRHSMRLLAGNTRRRTPSRKRLSRMERVKRRI